MIQNLLKKDRSKKKTMFQNNFRVKRQNILTGKLKIFPSLILTTTHFI